MAKPAEPEVERAVSAFRDGLNSEVRRLQEVGDTATLATWVSTLRTDPAAVGQAASDFAATLVRQSAGTSLIARRIGPVYGIADLARWMVTPGRGRLTGEAVRKRAKKHQLVAFLSDDGQYAFPLWQFDRLAGRLMVNGDIVALWQSLPHEGFLTDADLAAWMNTRLDGLDAGTPADYARVNGNNAPALHVAVARLRRRAA